METTNITYPDNVQMVEEEIPQILSDHIFVELEILSGKISQTDIDQYEKSLRDYESVLEETEAMGFKPKDLKKPIEPEYEIAYKKINVNLTNIVFTVWSVEWDEKNDHAIIVAEYLEREGGDKGQYNIKATKKEWMDMLQQFGAIHTKIIKTRINEK
jgi:hypothetical protein